METRTGKAGRISNMEINIGIDRDGRLRLSYLLASEEVRFEIELMWIFLDKDVNFQNEA